MISADRLKSTVLAQGLSAAQLERLAAHATEQVFAAGETMMQPDDGTFNLLVILEGECDVLGVMDDQINHLHEGMLVGEVAFLDRRSRSAKAVATSRCVTATFESELISRLRREDGDTATQLLLNLISVLCTKLRQATRWIDAGHV